MNVSSSTIADVNTVFRDCYRATFSLNYDLSDDSNSSESDDDMFYKVGNRQHLCTNLS